MPDQSHFAYSVVVRLAGFEAPAKIELADRGGITFLVGANNAGKSRLAAAMASTSDPGRTLLYDSVPVPVWSSGKETDRTAYLAVTSSGGNGRSTFKACTSDGEVFDEGASGPNLGTVDYVRQELLAALAANSDFGTRSFRLPTERAASLSPAEVDATQILTPTGDNLANVLLWLQTRDDIAWHRIRTAVEAVVPGLGRLLAKAEGGKVEAVVALPNGTDRPLSQLGSGVAQFLLVAVACETQPTGSIVVLDEPEVGLHPGSQRRMVAQLREWAQHSQIVVVTHSPFLIANRRPEDRIHWVRSGPNGSRVELVDEGLSDLFDELGVDALELLESKWLLVVEGETEVAVLPALFPELTARGVSVVSAGGGSKVERVAEAARKVGPERSGRRVWALTDLDEGPSVDEAVRPDQYSLVLGCREIENIFLEFPEAISRVLGSSVDEAELRLLAKDLMPRKQELVFRARLAEATREAVEQLRFRCMETNAPEEFELGDAAKTRLDEARKSLEAVPVEELASESFRSVAERWDSDWRSLVVGSDLLAEVWTKKCPGDGYGKKHRRGEPIAKEIRAGLKSGIWTAEGRPNFAALQRFISRVGVEAAEIDT